MFTKRNYKDITELSAEIIEAYAYYVRDEIREGRLIHTGIDDDLTTYKLVFFDILGVALGVPSLENPMTADEERLAVKVIEDKLNKNSIFTKDIKMVYTTCMEIFDIVIDEIEQSIL